MNPRIYDFTSIDPKTSKPTTVVNRMRDYRKAKKLGMSCAEYREHLELEKRQAKKREYFLAGDGGYKWLPEFITMIGLNPDKDIFVAPHAMFPIMRKDFDAVHKAWKRLATRLHPDRDGGDAIKMTRLNELWSIYENTVRARQLKYVPPPEPTVTPVRKRKKRKPVRKVVTHIPNLNPDCAEYTTACGKFVEDVTVVDANCSAAALPRLVTCKKCRAAWRAPITVTPEPPTKKPIKDDRYGCEMSKVELREYEDEFKARRQKEMEEATEKCPHTPMRGKRRLDDCLVCYPVDGQPPWCACGHPDDEASWNLEDDGDGAPKMCASPRCWGRAWCKMHFPWAEPPEPKVTTPTPDVESFEPTVTTQMRAPDKGARANDAGYAAAAEDAIRRSPEPCVMPPEDDPYWATIKETNQ